MYISFGVDIIKVHIRDKEYTRSHQFMYITHDNQIPFPKNIFIPLSVLDSFTSKLTFFYRMYRTLLNVVLYDIVRYIIFMKEAMLLRRMYLKHTCATMRLLMDYMSRCNCANLRSCNYFHFPF